MPPRFKKMSLGEFHNSKDQKPTKPSFELLAKNLQTKVWITNETNTCSPTLAVPVAASSFRDIIKDETQKAVSDQLKREEEALMEKQQQEKRQREYLQKQEQQQQQEQKLEVDNYALTDIDTNNTVDHDTENQDFIEEQVEITCEEAKKDPMMNPNEFAVKFKSSIQQILYQIRKLHSKQAFEYQRKPQNLEKTENQDSAIREAFARRLFEEYGLLAKMNGFDTEPMQRIMNFILVHRVCTSYYRKQRYHSTPLKERRFCAASFTYRGPNYSSDRFQIDNIKCELFKAFGWCDMKHVHTIASGDILFTQTDEYYWDEGSYETASSLCMILLPKAVYDYITPLFVCKLDEENRSTTTNPASFFHAMNRNSKHVCSSDIPKAVYSRRKITDANLENRQTSFVASFDQIQIWVHKVYNLKAEQTSEDASSSCSPLLPLHCEVLYGLGSEQHTFLNLLLNAMLPREVLCYILRLKFDNNSFPNFPRNRLTPEQFIKIIDECPGIANVFSVIHAFEQREKFEQTSADEFKDLFMLRMAMDIENYVTDSYGIYTLPTDISGHLTGISKISADVRQQYKNQELLRIIYHACKYGGDLEHLTSFHDFASWRASENMQSDKL